MISLFVFCFFLFVSQTFNGNFDQNTVEKEILFSAFVARYLRFVVGSKHGGACLRVEVSGVPRSRGLIYCRNCSVFKEYSFLPSWATLLHIIEKTFFFATTSALEPLSFSFFLKILLKYTVFASNSLYALLLSATKHTSQERAICNFAPKILYLKWYADLMSLESFNE